MPIETQTYPKYKPSGIDWLGDIPGGWDSRRIAAIFDFRNTKVSDKDFEPLSVTYDGVKKQVENAAKTDNSENRKLVKIGDIAINGRSDRKGAVGISKYDGSVSGVYHVLKQKNSGVEAKYFHYLFRSSLFSQEFFKWGRGIHDDLWTTRSTEMGHITVPLPPIETQKQIADFLDEKTRVIDALIEGKEKLIELLREKRVALITRAVTKGLNPKAKMKPSDIDWLGRIPAGWEVRKMRYLIGRNDGGVWGDTDDSEGTPVLRSTEVSIDGRWCIDEFELAYRGLTPNEIKKGKLEEGDLVVTKSSGSEEHIGKTAIVNKVIAERGYCYSNFMQRLRPKSGINPKILYYFLNSQSAREQYKYLSNSTIGLGNLNAGMLGELYFLLLPETEQKQIADFLDAETEKIDKAAALIESQIEKLKEYRSSLIYHAVTGKIKI
jgi:type I restriction enzyme, S subunit